MHSNINSHIGNNHFVIPKLLDQTGRNSSIFGILSRVSLFKFRFYMGLGLAMLLGEGVLHYLNANEAMLLEIWVAILVAVGFTGCALAAEPAIEIMYRKYLTRPDMGIAFKVFSMVLICLVVLNFIAIGIFRTDAHTTNKVIDQVEASRVSMERNKRILENSGATNAELEELERVHAEKEQALLQTIGAESLADAQAKILNSGALMVLNLLSGLLLGCLSSLFLAMAFVMYESIGKMRSIEKAQKKIAGIQKDIERDEADVKKIGTMLKEVEKLEEMKASVLSRMSQANMDDVADKAKSLATKEFAFEVQDLRTSTLQRYLNGKN